MDATTGSGVRLFNRELGILAFNERVLAHAEDESVPLLGYELLNRTLLPRLANAGVVVHTRIDWSDAQRQWAERIFETEIEPLLTPIALDPAHPFPRILNKSLNFIVELHGHDAFGRPAGIAIVQAPRTLPRILRVPPGISGAPHGMMPLTSIVQGLLGVALLGVAH